MAVQGRVKKGVQEAQQSMKVDQEECKKDTVQVKEGQGVQEALWVVEDA